MWQSLLVYNACPQPQTEATVLVSPSLLQIDTFGKWCRCLHNVCYLKLKKRRYLDKCRLSAPAESTAFLCRIHLRNEFMRVGLINVLDALEDDNSDELQTQLKVPRKMLLSDYQFHPDPVHCSENAFSAFRATEPQNGCGCMAQHLQFQK